jgi:glycolate oxidase iron-sulfur subunit
MQTRLPDSFLATDAGREADRILRACVHCGFCTATCPTYQLEGSELDSPRGRIYLLKNLLEDDPVTAITRHHLDRCLLCQACETTCPSDVAYHRLLAIGQEQLEQRLPRSRPQRLLRWLLRQVMSRRRVVVPLLRLGQWVRALLPRQLRDHVPPRQPPLSLPATRHSRRVILVQGCVQPGLSPNTNRAATRVLDRLVISTISVAAETCCGALNYHLHAQAAGIENARRNIDAWWPHIDAGAEAIVMTASGCSNFVQSYAELLARDHRYAARARRVDELLLDIGELLAGEDLSPLRLTPPADSVLHVPCTAQHGQALEGPVRDVLGRLGFSLPAVGDSHLCCGSAGTYSLFQPELAHTLRERKLENLLASAPAQIITANVGCQIHLGAGTPVPVRHWIEAVAGALD